MNGCEKLKPFKHLYAVACINEKRNYELLEWPHSEDHHCWVDGMRPRLSPSLTSVNCTRKRRRRIWTRLKSVSSMRRPVSCGRSGKKSFTSIESDCCDDIEYFPYFHLSSLIKHYIYPEFSLEKTLQTTVRIYLYSELPLFGKCKWQNILIRKM